MTFWIQCRHLQPHLPPGRQQLRLEHQQRCRSKRCLANPIDLIPICKLLMSPDFDRTSPSVCSSAAEAWVNGSIGVLDELPLY